MRAKIPDTLLGKLVFLSGVIWMLFGVLLLIAFIVGAFKTPSTPPDIFVLPVFGLVSSNIHFALDWLHVVALTLVPLSCIAVGLSVCVFVAPALTASKS
jgi:hypothetical protein